MQSRALSQTPSQVPSLSLTGRSVSTPTHATPETEACTDATDEDSQDLVLFDPKNNDVVPSELFTLMSCATTDPFDVLPVKPNHQVWKLLTSWLSAGAQFDAAQDGYRLQVSVIRKSWFWPLVRKNKASYHAAGRIPNSKTYLYTHC